MVGSCGKVKPADGLLEQVFRSAVRYAMLIDLRDRQPRVDLALSFQLTPVSGFNPLPDRGGRLATRRSCQLLLGYRRNLNLHVDAVKQWPGYFAAVAGYLVWGTAASTVVVSKVTARAGIHGGNQLKPCREIRLACGPGNSYPPRFQRFAQHLKHFAIELRQFIEEQHPIH